MLNGGWDRWDARDMPEETATPVPLPLATFTAQLNGGIYITKEEIAAGLSDPTLVLVDVRSDAEYAGTATNTAPRPGHIPGAVDLPYAALFNADKTVLSFSALKQLLESQGITKDKEIAVYSTVGKRSAFLYFLTRLMDYPDVRNYDGSAHEWGDFDPTLYPLKTGPNP